MVKAYYVTDSLESILKQNAIYSLSRSRITTPSDTYIIHRAIQEFMLRWYHQKTSEMASNARHSDLIKDKKLMSDEELADIAEEHKLGKHGKYKQYGQLKREFFVWLSSYEDALRHGAKYYALEFEIPKDKIRQGKSQDYLVWWELSLDYLKRIFVPKENIWTKTEEAKRLLKIYNKPKVQLVKHKA